MKTYDSVLIRYGELSLKGSNRSRFEKKLVSNIRQSLLDCPHGSIRRRQGGIWLGLEDDSPVETITERLRRVAGIAWFAPCWKIPRTIDAMEETALGENTDAIRGASTFAINTQRSDKQFPLTSEEVSTELGARVEQATGLSVDLDHPDWTVHVHILDEFAYLFFQRHEGMHGLPMGSTGPVLSQFSGGIDSPVASIMSIRRGCHTDFVHFYSYPSAEVALSQGIGDLAEQLAPFTTGSNLFMVPYHPFELGTTGVPEEFEMLLFRRHTMRVSKAIADRHGHQAVITGESLGQVASQTMSNMKTIAAAADIPVFRPVIGMNKNEIIERARQYNTYQTSITDYRDCCSIRSKHPRTSSRLSRAESLEAEHNVEELDEKALDETKIFHFSACSPRPEATEMEPGEVKHEQAI